MECEDLSVVTWLPAESSFMGSISVDGLPCQPESCTGRGGWGADIVINCPISDSAFKWPQWAMGARRRGHGCCSSCRQMQAHAPLLSRRSLQCHHGEQRVQFWLCRKVWNSYFIIILCKEKGRTRGVWQGNKFSVTCNIIMSEITEITWDIWKT